MEAQSRSYDRLVAEGDAECAPLPGTDEHGAEEIEAKWRDVLACFDGTREGSVLASPSLGVPSP